MFPNLSPAARPWRRDRNGPCLVVVGALALAATLGCGDKAGPTPVPSPVPSAPTPAPPPSQPAAAFTLRGHVVSAVDRAPIGGARVAPEVGDAVVTAADGTFSSPTNPQLNVYKVTVAASSSI